MSTSLTRIAKATAAMAVLTAASISAAQANQVTFTWAPSATSPALTNAGPITANNFTLTDYSSINVRANGTFTEQGYLSINQFQLDGVPVITEGLNGAAGAIKYGLYFDFTATGTLTGFNPADPSANVVGAFDTLTYTLNGDVGGNDKFNNFTSQHQVYATGTTGDIPLADGTLISSTVGILGGIPFANSLQTYMPDVMQSGFFVSPSAIVDSLILEDTFSNTSGESHFYTTGLLSGYVVTYTINAGGGSADLIPEPASLALLGAGLLGLAVTRKSRKTAA